MTQVSVGQIENLEDLTRGLESVREELEKSFRELIAAAERQCAEAREETQNSENMLDQACHAEQEAQQALDEAQQDLESAQNARSAAYSSLLACEGQPPDEDGRGPDCSGEEAVALEAQAASEVARDAFETANVEMERAKENRQRMEQRVECAKQALAEAEFALELAEHQRATAMCRIGCSIDTGKTRLVAAHYALEAYLATNPAAAQFYEWLHWHPEHGKPITPDIIRDRMNLSREQQRLLQEYLYDRNPAYRNLVDKYRSEWVAANGDDVERNLVIRKARINLSGEYAEQVARQALAPLGGSIETQGRTFVGDQGRYTKTDLIVKDLRVPVVLGRGEGMGAPVGGSMAFEVKCGKADYLYSQKDHMLFQAEGHKQADAHCTLCSRDIHDLTPEKEKELRDALRASGSPLVGMLPAKNDIDRSCLEFIQQDKEGDLQ